MGNRIYRVFVSSTFKDMKSHRRDIREALLASYCFPIGMESWSASNRTPLEVIKNHIDECDFYILIISERYGSYVDGNDSNSVSYTEAEYDYAKDRNKPMFCFIKECKGRNSNESEGDEKSQRLMNFIKKVREDNKRTFKEWHSYEKLKLDIIQTIQNAKIENPEIGLSGTYEDDFSEKSTGLVTNNRFTGIWKAVHQDGSKRVTDTVDITHYDPDGGFIYGTVSRTYPKNESGRKWNAKGIIEGENVVVMYYNLNSVGCAYVRHYHENIYRGLYIRYNYGTHLIESLNLTFKR